MTNKRFRTNGAIGALLDEYEKAIVELQELISKISNEELVEVVDEKAKNSGLYSIQNVLSHVLKAGDWYKIEIRNSLGEKLENPELNLYNSVNEYCEQLAELLSSTELIFEENKTTDLYVKRNFRWEHIFNIDMLLEHAIVHVLRHRRQIERFISSIRNL